jgi:hypothetical protein
LHQEFITLGFTQSKVDKCLYYTNKCIIIIYVNDCLLFSPDDNHLDKVIQHLGNTFQMTTESDIGAYLGLNIQKTEQGKLEITQPGLIDKAVQLCGLEVESNVHKTPADSILQPPSPHNEARQLPWNYRQIIGILNYIAASSRPDISFAVHQCAQFSSAPTRKHELALKQIVRYRAVPITKGSNFFKSHALGNCSSVSADHRASYHALNHLRRQQRMHGPYSCPHHEAKVSPHSY